MPVCHLLRSGVAALFGPQSGTTSSHVQSICDAMEIPHIETRWDYRLKRDDYSVNLYPHPTTISKVSTKEKFFIVCYYTYFYKTPSYSMIQGLFTVIRSLLVTGTQSRKLTCWYYIKTVEDLSHVQCTTMGHIDVVYVYYYCIVAKSNLIL